MVQGGRVAVCPKKCHETLPLFAFCWQYLARVADALLVVCQAFASGAQGGDIQVSLQWDTIDDLDLHVVTNQSTNNGVQKRTEFIATSATMQPPPPLRWRLWVSLAVWLLLDALVGFSATASTATRKWKMPQGGGGRCLKPQGGGGRSLKTRPLTLCFCTLQSLAPRGGMGRRATTWCCCWR